MATTRRRYGGEPQRSSDVVTEILGPDFDGIVGNDRARAYLVLDPEQRQICWFHLGRNFQTKIELALPGSQWDAENPALSGRPPQ